MWLCMLKTSKEGNGVGGSGDGDGDGGTTNPVDDGLGLKILVMHKLILKLVC